MISTSAHRKWSSYEALQVVMNATLSLVLVACSGGSSDAPVATPTTPTEFARSGARLSWTAVAGATHYEVYASCGAEVHPCTAADKISSPSVTGTTFDLDYNNPRHLSDVYRVVACNGGGCSPSSSPSTVEAIASLAMSAAVATDVTGGQTVTLLGHASPKKGKTVASWQWLSPATTATPIWATRPSPS